MFVLLAVAVGAAVVMALLAGRGDEGATAVALSFYMVGGTIGALFAYFRVVRRSFTRNTIMDRFAYAGIGGLGMLIGLAPAEAAEEQVMLLILAPMAVLFLCDWTQRIELGRRGQVSAGSAFWPAVLGAIAGAIFGADDYALVAGGVCAMLSLLCQAGAALWPTSASATPPPPKPKESSEIQAVIQAAAACCGDEQPAEQAAAKVEQPDAAVDHKKDDAKETVASDAPPTPAAQPVVIDGTQPSFVGRTASAGLSFLGKVLLLTAFTAAFVLASEPEILEGRPGKETGVRFVDGNLTVLDHGRHEASVKIPTPILLFPLLLGSVLLMVARRHDGGAHFLRGFLGCLFGILATLLAVGPAAGDLKLFFREDMTLPSGGGDQVIMTGILLAFSLALLFWPKRQGAKPIVV